MIQTTIARLAGQSATIKGWSVTLTGALLGLASTATTALLAALAIYVTVVFAVLDGYYLSLERSYRTLYNTTRTATGPTDYAMTIAPPTTSTVLRSLTSFSIAPLYGSALAAATAVFLYTLHK